MFPCLRSELLLPRSRTVPETVGLILLSIFGVQLRWVNVAGGTTDFKTMILPSVTLALSMSAKYTRQVRNAVLEELRQDYVIGARMRGIKESVILWRHVLPNAMLPIVTLLGLSLGSLLGGTAVVEIIRPLILIHRGEDSAWYGE